MTPAPTPREFQSTATQAAQWWTCVILGAPRTKKTSQRIARTKDGRPFILQSKLHDAWSKTAILQIQAQWGGAPPLTCPVNLAAFVYRARAVGDARNYGAAIDDALERAGVVKNDRQIVSHDGSRLLKDAARPRVELTIHWAAPLVATCAKCTDVGVLPWGPAPNAVEISHTPAKFCDCPAGPLARAKWPVGHRGSERRP